MVAHVVDFLSAVLDNNSLWQVAMSSLSENNGAIMASTELSVVASSLVTFNATSFPWSIANAGLERWIRLYLNNLLNDYKEITDVFN